MKKVISVLMTLVMCMALTACGSSSASDLEYVKNKGTLVVGVTDFEPMDYKNENGDWIGFDADVAVGFAESLGVAVEFVEIDWDNKVLELDGKQVDCIWNGMTLTDEVKSSMSCTKPYLNNAQIVVVKKEKAESCKTVEELANLNFAVEAGSAGQEVCEEKGLKFTPVKSQADAVLEASAGTSDGAIIDSLMAAAMVGDGTSYSDLTYTITLNSEEYGVGFRKGSDLTEKLNEYFDSAMESGSMDVWAYRYGVQASLIK